MRYVSFDLQCWLIEILYTHKKHRNFKFVYPLSTLHLRVLRMNQHAYTRQIYHDRWRHCCFWCVSTCVCFRWYCLVATHTDQSRSFRRDRPLQVQFVSDMVRGVFDGVRCLLFLRSPIWFLIPNHSVDILDISSS